MILKKLIIAGIVFAVCISGGVYLNKLMQISNQNEIKLMDYRPPEKADENGYQIVKYEDLDACEWINQDKVMVIKYDETDNNSNSNGSKGDKSSSIGYISIYDLNSKTYTDYKNAIVDSKEPDGISPNGRFILYGEPRSIPEVESEEWYRQCETQELFHEKKDILDLETGEIISDFDKIVNNCSAQYMWINDDKIFVNYGGEWAILNKEGKSIKRGMFNFDNEYADYASVIGIDDIKDNDDVLEGRFYYTKECKNEDGSLGSKIYSMDINTLYEEYLFKCEESINPLQEKNIIALDLYYNNGEADENGIYNNRTFGFKITDLSGNLINSAELPQGRFVNVPKISSDGKKAVFCDTTNIKDKDTLNDSISIMDIKSGDITKLVSICDLIDKDNQEEFLYWLLPNKTKKIPGPKFGKTLKWDSSGKSLMYTYMYTSKIDGENHTDTYVLTFDD